MKRTWIIGAVGLALLAVAVVLIGRGEREASRSPQPARAPSQATGPATAEGSGAGGQAPAARASGAASEQAEPGERPSFDVVRIEQGHAVMAGRAEPGASVRVLDSQRAIGETGADSRGEWVLTPGEPLAPGNHELSLSARLPDGRILDSEGVVVLVVPEPGKDIAGRPGAGGGALALAVPRKGTGPSTVLQLPAPSQPTAEAGTEKRGLSLDVVDYDPEGHLVLSGHAPKGQAVQVYLDNDFLGRAEPDPEGRWKLMPERKIGPGPYTLRLDAVDPGGRVSQRIAMPFSGANAGATLPAGASVVVQPGNSLWRLARHSYGAGLRYTIIYQANREQIRDPNLIYPGQRFVIPKEGDPPPTN